MNWLCRLSLLVSLVLSPSQSFSADVLGIESVLSRALGESDRFRAIQQSIEATQSDLSSRDVGLIPKFQAEASTLMDSRDAISVDPDRTLNTGLLGFTYQHPFSTGTELTVIANNSSNKWDLPDVKQNNAAWELRLSQNLWSNGFGRLVSLKEERNRKELDEKTYSLHYERQNLLVSLENLYWELIYSEKQLGLRQENVKHSQTLEKWANRRFKQYASENADLIQVQALLGQRELDLMAAENQIKALRKQLSQYFSGVDISQWQFDSREFEIDRDINRLTFSSSPSNNVAAQMPLRLDAIAAKYTQERTRSEADIVKDTNRPDLDLFFSYGGQGINEKLNTSWDRTVNGKNSMEKVGLLFTYNLDMGRQAEQEKAARRTADSNESRARSLDRQSSEAWSEIQSNLSSLKEQVKVARRIYEMNRKRIGLERQRFQQGRTTTLQMTTAEVEMSDSELRYYRLLADLRKTEGLVRTYTFTTHTGS